MSEKAEVTFTKNYSTIVIEESACFISKSRFKKMIERLEKVDDNTSFYNSAAWTLTGVAITSFISAILLPINLDQVPNYVQIICWAIFSVSLLIALISFKYSNTHKQDRNQLRLFVIEDMQEILDKHSVVKK